MALIDLTYRLPKPDYEITGSRREVIRRDEKYLEVLTFSEGGNKLLTQYKAVSFLGIVRFWKFNGWECRTGK